MDLEKIMNERWSCRAFLDELVPDDLLTEMFGLAQQTASWCNTQPWRVHLLSGEATTRFAQALSDHVARNLDNQTPDFTLPDQYHGVYADRRRESGMALYASLGISRADRELRAQQAMANFSFFGAPHVAIITSDRDQGVYGAVDCGAYVANLLNNAYALGIATVAQGALAMHAGAIRDLLELPQDRMIVCGVALGFADLSDLVNTCRTDRADLAEVVEKFDLTPAGSLRSFEQIF